MASLARNVDALASRLMKLECAKQGDIRAFNLDATSTWGIMANDRSKINNLIKAQKLPIFIDTKLLSDFDDNEVEIRHNSIISVKFNMYITSDTEIEKYGIKKSTMMHKRIPEIFETLRSKFEKESSTRFGFSNFSQLSTTKNGRAGVIYGKRCKICSFSFDMTNPIYIIDNEVSETKEHKDYFGNKLTQGDSILVVNSSSNFSHGVYLGSNSRGAILIEMIYPNANIRKCYRKPTKLLLMGDKLESMSPAVKNGQLNVFLQQTFNGEVNEQ